MPDGASLPDILRPDRRTFLKTMALGAATPGLPGGLRASEGRVVPLGELAARMTMAGQRLTVGTTPAFTPSFVLADVALSPPRRFNEFSGDLSGRYIGALATSPLADNTSLSSVVKALLDHQRPDGRFGSAELAFTPEAIGPPHMALLWGNGRLLVGLLEYWQSNHDVAVLSAARRLADFLVKVQRSCSEPAVARRLEGQGAMGFICFTQLVEGLVLINRATGAAGYLRSAAEIVPLLEPRGVQHSHGYLSTLRGVMLLHEATRDRGWLEFVTTRYADLVGSSDFTIYGSVLEYFGWETPGVTDAQRQRLLAASGNHPRDEGCSTADLVRLSLQLWRATGDTGYLDRAEWALENSLYPNQWETGDFGSRVTFPRGLMATGNAARCWWCCTMHGHRALADVLAASVVEDGAALRVTLLGEATWSRDTTRVSVTRRVRRDGAVAWTISVEGLDPSIALLARHPHWATATHVQADGRAMSPDVENGFIRLRLPGLRTATFEVVAQPRCELRTRKGERIDPAALPADGVDAALCCGPWLLAADELREPAFFGEPWPDNVVHVPAAPRVTPATPGPPGGAAVLLSTEYEHAGFPGLHRVTLTPLGVMTTGPQRTLGVWLRYGR